jgi:pyrroloquinoline quinone biosynthesis protein B
VLTNADVDAIAGLLHLREGTPFALYAHRAVLGILDRNPLFEVLDRRIVPRRELEPDGWQMLRLVDGSESGLEIRAFPVPGKVPLYEEQGSMEVIPGAAGLTTGLEIRSGGARLAYVANCAEVTDDVRRRLAGMPLVFFDGTLFHDDEMIRQEVGTKTGRRMGHVSIAGPAGSLAALDGLGIGRRVFLHINNTNPILVAGSAERKTVEAAGFEVGFDGMDIAL